MESLAASSFSKDSKYTYHLGKIAFKTGISAALRDKPHPEFGNLHVNFEKQIRPKLN